MISNGYSLTFVRNTIFAIFIVSVDKRELSYCFDYYIFIESLNEIFTKMITQKIFP